jgi:hypothetical protein
MTTVLFNIETVGTPGVTVDIGGPVQGSETLAGFLV